jgi:two-component system sensor histidine kinase BaeS
VVFVVLALLAAAVVVLAVLAWRRVSRPMGDLLDAAERVGTDADALPPVAVPASTPHELRSLIEAFNTMTARIARSEHERRRFLADVTHELRTPLTVLRSGIEAQLDGVHERDDVRLAALLDETVILGRLIDDLHTLALTEAGQLRLQRTPTELGALIDEALVSFAPAATAKAVEVDRVGSGERVVAEVDGGRIRQVLGNLLANAVRHVAVGGHVEVELRVEADRAVLAVRDDGPGIAVEDLAEVFTRYRKAADSGGSGLGLTIARDLVTAHDGTIDARNNAPEPGATIEVVLPLVAREHR